MKALLALLFVACIAPAWAGQAGRIDIAEGDVRVIDASGKERPAKVGELVQEGEMLQTGADGEIHVLMDDGGQIALHANTRMRILKYKAEGGKEDRSVLNLLQGAMRSVTGWIGKYNPRNYEVRTPTATIGVRGTDHETRVIPEGSREGEPGTYDKVNAGATLLRGKFGTTEIRPNQAGFASLTGKARPKVLPSVPGFFKPLRQEKRFDGLHDKVRKNLDQQRQQRVLQIKETRKSAGQQRQEARREQLQQRRLERDQQRLKTRQEQQDLRQKMQDSRRQQRLQAQDGHGPQTRDPALNNRERPAQLRELPERPPRQFGQQRPEGVDRPAHHERRFPGRQ